MGSIINGLKLDTGGLGYAGLSMVGLCYSDMYDMILFVLHM